MKTFQAKNITIAFVCLISFLLSPMPAFSKESPSIGKVIAIRGKAVAVSSSSDSRSLILKSPIFINDTIKTKNGRLQMMFKDNTLVTLGRNSEMQITKYLWEPGNSNSAMETKVQEGSFRIMGGAITRIAPDNFKTDAPSGTIGIRGSMYAGQVKGQQLFVLFQGGKGIYVENKAGIVEITRPGFGTRITGNTLPPEPPSKVTPEKLQEIETLLTKTSIKESPEPSAPSAQGVGAPKAEQKIDTASEESSPRISFEMAMTSSEPGEGTSKLLPELEMPVTPEDLSDFPKGPPRTPLPPPIPPSSPFPIPDPGEPPQKPSDEPISELFEPAGTEQEIQFMLLGLGVSDISPSTSIPSSGIWDYQGEMTNTLNPDDHTHTMKFVVNWNNRRIIGFEDASSGAGGIGFAFGDVDASGGISNMTVLGSDAQGGVMALTGSETFGQFYGAGQGGLGLAMEGYDYNIQDQTQSQFWSDLVAARVISTSGGTPTGSETWNGFFIGVSEDMSDPNTGRRVFHNTSNANFSLTINKSAGTFTGNLAGPDFNPSGYAINVSSIGGGPSNSAYINDKIFAATLNTADISPPAAGLKPYGNFIVTANDAMLSDYTTWGYWEAAYEESPSPGDDYHLHVPGSRWIAGVQASIPGSFTGVYQGGAKGVMLSSSSQMQDLTGGTTTLNIDFTGVSTPVWGNISFNEINLPVTTVSAANLVATGFNGTISGATTSSVNGSFYGPTIPGSSAAGPAAVGGNFSAEISGTQYHGIFAGDLQ